MVGAWPVLQETYAISSVGRRFAALIMDLVLLLIASGVVAAVLGGWHGSTRTYVGSHGSVFTSTSYYMDSLWTQSLLAVLSALYTIPLWSRWGATLGQRTLGLRVLDVAAPKPLPWRRAAIRWFVLFSWTFIGIASYFNGVFTLLILVWVIVMLAAVMRDGRKQGYHDRASGSLVVNLVRYWVMPFAQPNVAPPPPAASVWH